MKFFHLGDLHFGKTLYDIQLAEKDQPYWIERFFEKTDEYRPDAVLIAGDVYDRRDPAPEIMALYDRFITGLAERGVKVFVAPGNHDSALRVSYAGKLLEESGIYTAGLLSKELPHVSMSDGGQKITVWMMPYVFPKLVADVLENSDLKTYNDAVRALLDAQKINRDEINILVAHQNVLAHGQKPEHSRSESIIGGVGEVDFTVFKDFDYVALGHIHNAQPVGRETVRYSGCPMYYDFSEIERSKALTLVTVGGKDDIKVEPVEISLRHKLERVTGTVEELVALADDYRDKDGLYFQALVNEKTMPPRTRDRLHAAYGNALINIAQFKSETDPAKFGDEVLSGGKAEKPIDEQFRDFYYLQMEKDLDESQEKFLMTILEQQERHSGVYITDFKNVPERDTDELVQMLLNGIGEDEK